MRKVLVTGINGFVGSHLTRELGRHGISIEGVGGPIVNGPKLDENIHYNSLDLTDRKAADSIDFSGVDGIIHLAGLAAVGPSFNDPMLYLNTNLGIQVNLLEAALTQNCKPRVLVISSGSLYDPAATLPLTEQSDVLPSSPYAVSKLGQEQMARYYMTRGFECVVARPFNHIGPGQGLGFIVPDLTQQIIGIEKGEGHELLVGNLDAKRDYTDVRDIVKAYRLILEKGKSGDIYNICSGSPLSGHQLLEGLLKITGQSPEIKQDPQKMRPSDNPVIYGSHQKLTTATGWQPEIVIDQTLADVVEDWRQRD
jgi:GDP-4-dehydro-6-deoxy-D-mannose reductase